MMISWHRGCEINSTLALKAKERELEQFTAIVDEARRGVIQYRAQIALAEKEGKDGFDRDKYAIKRLAL